MLGQALFYCITPATSCLQILRFLPAGMERVRSETHSLVFSHWLVHLVHTRMGIIGSYGQPLSSPGGWVLWSLSSSNLWENFLENRRTGRKHISQASFVLNLLLIYLAVLLDFLLSYLRVSQVAAIQAGWWDHPSWPKGKSADSS